MTAPWNASCPVWWVVVWEDPSGRTFQSAMVSKRAAVG